MELDNLPANQELPILSAKLTYFDYRKQLPVFTELNNFTVKQSAADPFIMVHYSRQEFVRRVADAMQAVKSGSLENAQAIIKSLAEALNKHLKDLAGGTKEELEAAQEQLTRLIKDVEGEVTLAFAKQFSYDHWGIHYLPSLSNAHARQQCNNFKDPGVQKYGGKLFNTIKDDSEQIFINLPPPKHVFQQIQESDLYNDENLQYKPVQQAQQIIFQNPVQNNQNQPNMECFYNGGGGGGGCFSGDCEVALAGGRTKRVKDIQKGDQLKNSGQVVAVIKICGQDIQLLEVGSALRITPNHPLLWQGRWAKPHQLLEKQQARRCDSTDVVYNFVLDSGHTIEVGGVVCATLGHGLKGANVEHPYFGSAAVIEDLKKDRNWAAGFVVVSLSQFVRAKSGGQVCAISVPAAH